MSILQSFDKKNIIIIDLYGEFIMCDYVFNINTDVVFRIEKMDDEDPRSFLLLFMDAINMINNNKRTKVLQYVMKDEIDMFNKFTVETMKDDFLLISIHLNEFAIETYKILGLFKE